MSKPMFAVVYVGAPYGDNELGQVVSRHRSREAAENAVRELQTSPRYYGNVLIREVQPTKTVKVRLLHNTHPSLLACWCEPVGWEPATVIDGQFYSDGAWWDDTEEVGGLIYVRDRRNHHVGDVVEVNLDDLRVASSLDVRVIGKVKIKE